MAKLHPAMPDRWSPWRSRAEGQPLHNLPPCTASTERSLVVLVSLSDLLCRMGGLGYGYSEDRQVNFLEEPGFTILEKECPKLNSFDWARFTFELEAYLDEVHQLVNLLYRGSQ